MGTVTLYTPPVQSISLCTSSDGELVRALTPVAAYLCGQEYPDAARIRVLERLADGDTPRGCVEAGALDPTDLAEVERLLATHTEYPTPEEWAEIDREATAEEHDAAEVLAAEFRRIIPEPPAPGTETLAFPEWIESMATLIRSHGSDAAGWLAGHISLIAKRAAFVEAKGPADYDDRVEVLESGLVEAGREPAGPPTPETYPW